MNKIKVLFVCIHNSARSQMAEAFLNNLGDQFFEAYSAGIEPGTLNPLVVNAMHEIGIDISKNRTKDVYEFLDKGESFDYIITVCDEGNAARCPVFPGKGTRLHWSFADPSAFTGSADEKLVQVRIVRDAINQKIETFVESVSKQ